MVRIRKWENGEVRVRRAALARREGSKRQTKSCRKDREKSCSGKEKKVEAAGPLEKKKKVKER